MTKKELINAVSNSYNRDNVSKRLVEEIIEKTFGIISKAFKKEDQLFDEVYFLNRVKPLIKRQYLSIPSF